MKTFKDRYRRVPIELLLSPAYERLSPDAKLVVLTLILSPRQTPPGVYDGTLKALEFETTLSSARLKAAITAIGTLGLLEAVPGGGWWLRDSYRWQTCNQSYEAAAIRMLSEKWPDLLPRFRQHNASILGKWGKHGGTTDPPTNPPPSPHRGDTEARAGTEDNIQVSEADSGAGGAQATPPATGLGPTGKGSGGGADLRGAGGSDAPAPPASFPQGYGKGEGAENPAAHLSPEQAAWAKRLGEKAAEKRRVNGLE